jgi:hypothetical protein
MKKHSKKRKSTGFASSIIATPAHVARVVDFPSAQEAAERGECGRAIAAFGNGAVNLGKSRSGPVEGEAFAEWKTERDKTEAVYQQTLKVINKSCARR